MLAIPQIDRVKLSGTGVSEAHAKTLLDKIDETIERVNLGLLEDFEVYVDPAGDDSNSGAENSPIATLYEAAKRLSLTGNASIYLSAGIHELPDHTGTTRRTILQCLAEMNVYGTVETLTSFTVASVTDNVITAQGSPGWTPNEFKGKRILVAPWGPQWQYRLMILSNTADSLTVCVIYDDMEDGWFLKPVPDEVIPITTNASRIVSNSVNPGSSENVLYGNGVVYFHDIDFDENVNPGGYYGVSSWTAQGSLNFYSCNFYGWSVGVYFSGDGYLYSAWIEGCSRGTYGSGSILISDLVGIDCTAPFATQHGYVRLSGGIWAQDCYVIGEINGGGKVTDYTTWIWVDSVGRYMQFAGFGQYEKIFNELRGWSGHDTMSFVFTTLAGMVGMIMAYSENCTLLGSVAFFRFDTVDLTLADYIAGNAPAVAPEVYSDNKGNNAQEYY